ncbi:hypothetical protein DY000_02013224 [Brassica cretica]|uniref:Uncharacterized protein n=1 Tax=Brassica cretica TaxID=69181 RepID=A0ABQ7CTD2_BRACR|nr:hypothetical protein DY000_02013224 [Brassica cretica]
MKQQERIWWKQPRSWSRRQKEAEDGTFLAATARDEIIMAKDLAEQAKTRMSIVENRLMEAKMEMEADSRSGTDRVSGQFKISGSGSLSGGSIILLSLSGFGVRGYPGVGYPSKNHNIRRISGSGFGS